MVWGARGGELDWPQGQGAGVGEGWGAAGGGGREFGPASAGRAGRGGGAGGGDGFWVSGVTAAVVPEGAGPTHPLVRRARAAGTACVTPDFLLQALLARRRPTLPGLRGAEG